MTQEQEIKGILVHFFREGTKGDYLNALNSAIKEIQQVKNCYIPDVSTRTFRFSGMKDGEKFVKEIKAPNREIAIADFELTYPDLTWQFSTDIT
jgi:hypothetical protein